MGTTGIAAQPAARRRVGDHSMRRVGPPEPEQLGQDRLAGIETSLLVLRMGVALLAEQEACAGNSRGSAGVKRRPHASGVDNAPGRQDRDFHCGTHPLEQLEHRR